MMSNNRVQWAVAVSAFPPLSGNSKTLNFNQRLEFADKEVVMDTKLVEEKAKNDVRHRWFVLC